MLDQGQTITIDTVAQVYNLTQFDGFKTERTGTLADGSSTKLRIDHQEQSSGAKRHLHQYQESVVDSVSGDSGTITYNITVSHPAWADKVRIAKIAEGVNAFVETNIARTLNMES